MPGELKVDLAAAWLRELELRGAYGYEHDFPAALQFAKPRLVPVETAAVFGSLARGEGSVDSDVDLLLVRADKVTGERALAWDDQVNSLVTAVRSWSGNPAQPYDISVSDLRAHVEADEPIVRLILDGTG